MTGILRLELVGVPPVIQATRLNEVPQSFWLQLWAEWGSDGDHPGRAVSLPLERMLARMTWLAPACRRFGVSIDWDPALASLVKEVRTERIALDETLRHPPSVSEEDALTLMASGGFTRELRQFQMRDLRHLLGLSHGANFSVPGAGKTTVAYAVYAAQRATERVAQMLVVAPLSAFDSWQTEVGLSFASTRAPNVGTFGESIPRDAEVVLVNYHRLAGNYSPLAKWVASTPTLVLLDEAHRMKRGWAGQWGAACLNLAFLAARRDILSGTPAPQGPADLVALIDYLWPGQARRVLPAPALVSPPPADAGRQVGRAIEPLFARTRKSELGLDKPRLSVVEIQPDGLHAAIYQALVDRYAGTLTVSMNDRAQLSQMGDVVMYLLEAATNPHLLSAGSSDQDAVEFRHPPLDVPVGSRLWDLLQQYNQYETPGKFRTLVQLVAANAEAGRKTLIWSNFVRNLLSLERMLAVYKPALIYGAIPSEVSAPEASRTREAELAKFRTDADCLVLLANPASMSEGVSLHQICHDAVYLERTFNAGQYLQSVDRIHRLGLAPDQQTRITFLLSKGTIDEVVDGRVADKASRLGEMLDDTDLVTMALPSDEDYGPAIDTYDDLVALFAHLRGER